MRGGLCATTPTPTTADAVAFEEQSAHTATAAWLGSDGSFCLAPRALTADTVTVEVGLPQPEVDNSRRRVRICVQLSSRDGRIRTVDVVQVRMCAWQTAI